ncbi:MAG: phosphodiester glycosidase family protein [Clostridia bacterium]|nr:phosphodiester glycosidase family protein [Clostridia bacterium]
MKKSAIKLLAMALAVIMLVGVVPVYAFAASIDYDTDRDDDYYKLISKKDWELAPGITESEIVLNNAASTHRQVAHVVEVDLNNPYTKVIPSTYKMAEGLKNKDYKVQIMSEQAAYAEANGYGNVVAAMNIALSWYDSAYYTAHPELIGEPLGYLVLDGVVYKNSQGQTAGAQTCLVINFDEKDGVARPEDMPKLQIRSTKDAITGWEEQVIPANFGFLVKDGVNQYTKNHTSDPASRSFMGIKADGTFVMVMNDGRQSPYSAGFNSYEMAEFMLSLGCVYAVNGDGGGSSAFLSQRPGEELKVNCRPSDGAERPTTHGILVISTATATGEFVRATVSAENEFYTPYSTVQFSAVGSDLVGTLADIPADACWQLDDPSMGTIDENGLFVSNGTVGSVKAQIVYKGEVVGEYLINIVVPESLRFVQPNIVAPYNKTVPLELVAMYGYNEVVLKAGDVEYALSDAAMGTINGMEFSTTSDEAITGGSVTATLTHDTSVTVKASVTFGKASKVVYDFEQGASSIENITLGYKNGYPASNGNWYDEIGVVTAETGMVKNGQYAMKIVSNNNSTLTFSWQQTQYNGWNIDLTDAVSISFWMYIPEGSHGAEWDIGSAIPIKLGHEFVYGTGWQYFTVPVKDIGTNVTNLNQIRLYRSDNGESSTNYNPLEHPNYYADITFYLDDITVNYSTAVDDNHAPIIKDVLLSHDATDTGLQMNGQTIPENTVSITANIADDTSYGAVSGLNTSAVAVYVDGNMISSSCNANGFVTTGNITLANGTHVFRIEAADKNGNTSYVEKTIVVNKVGNDKNTIKYAPKNPTLTNLLSQSVYWMDLTATAIDKVQAVEMIIDLDLNSDWELDHMILAEGFEVAYYIDSATNDAKVVITRTGKVTATGEAVIAQLPIRVWEPSYANDGTHLTHRLVAVESFIELGILTETDGTVTPFGSEKLSAVTEFDNIRTNGDKDENWHEHTAEAVVDQAPTCTTAGYTGRTYCAICDSIVDWGTDVPATGHSYVVTGSKLVCDCGDEYTGSGLIVVNGTTYYTFNGELRHSWIELDDGWYYFNPRTYAGPNGKHTTLDGITFVFENGRLTTGVWEQVPAGMRYWYGPAFYRDQTNDATSSRPYVIDGKTYLFNRAGIMQTGIVNSFVADGTLYYDCGTDGVATLLNGVYKDQLYIDGVRQVRYRLVAYNDDIYFVNDGDKILKNARVYLGNAYVAGKTFPDGRAIQPGYYTFDAEGKMVIEPLKNGVVGDYLYINDVKQTRYKLVAFEGAYYFINDGDKIVKNMRLYLSATYVNGKTFPDGRAILPGYYSFDAEGKMIIDPLKDGVVGDYLYINDVKQTRYKLVEHDGNLYFINDGDKIAKNMKLYLSATYVSGKTFPDGRAIVPGYYNFDAEGKMVIPAPQHGVVDGYLYINDVKQTRYKLVEFEGNFYFINDGDKIAKNTRLYLSATYVSGKFFSDGRAIAPGFYNFDAEGKMIVEPLKNGVIGDYLYINDVKQTRYKLVEFEGDYYFINDGDKIAKNTRLYLNAGFVAGTSIPAGYYRFDANGKLILE